MTQARTIDETRPVRKIVAVEPPESNLVSAMPWNHDWAIVNIRPGTRPTSTRQRIKKMPVVMAKVFAKAVGLNFISNHPLLLIYYTPQPPPVFGGSSTSPCWDNHCLIFCAPVAEE